MPHRRTPPLHDATSRTTLASKLCIHVFVCRVVWVCLGLGGIHPETQVGLHACLCLGFAARCLNSKNAGPAVWLCLGLYALVLLVLGAQWSALPFGMGSLWPGDASSECTDLDHVVWYMGSFVLGVF